MAVNLGADLKYKFSIFFETVDPADDARLQAGEDWLSAEELAYKERTRDVYMLEFSRTDRPWRVDFLPRKLRLEKDKELPDFIASFPGCNNTYANANMVSSRLKSLIEDQKKEKDGWQFFPVDILNGDDSVYGTYYIWWVHKVVDALDEESEGLQSVAGGKFRGPNDLANYSGDISPERQRLHKSIVAGLSAWIDCRFFPSERIFVSDELFGLMRDAGMTGMDAHSVWSEV